MGFYEQLTRTHVLVRVTRRDGSFIDGIPVVGSLENESKPYRFYSESNVLIAEIMDDDIESIVPIGNILVALVANASGVDSEYDAFGYLSFDDAVRLESARLPFSVTILDAPINFEPAIPYSWLAYATATQARTLVSISANRRVGRGLEVNLTALK